MTKNQILEDNLCLPGIADAVEGLSSGVQSDGLALCEQLSSTSGLPVTRIMGEDGRWYTLHSMVDPLNESDLIATKAALEPDRIIVILGAGNGYHIQSICQHTHLQPIVIVEKAVHILRQLLSRMRFSDLLNGRSIYIAHAADCESVINKISQIQMAHGMKSFRVVEHPASVKAFPTYYRSISKSIHTINRFDVARKLMHVRFKSSQLNILLLHSKYYLLYEILNALKILGHETRTVMVPSGRAGQGAQHILEDVLINVSSFKPDFVLTVNHLGFDCEGILAQLFATIRLPFASWYVDSPLFILDDYKCQSSPYLTIFVWDNDYVKGLKEQGFEHVHFLPLATDPQIFRHVGLDSNPLKHLACSVGFVGNSSEKIVHESLVTLKADKNIHALIDKLALQFLNSQAQSPGNMMPELHEHEQRLYAQLMGDNKRSLEPAITWRATQLYRLECIRQLLPFKPSIHGDDGWTLHLSGSCTLRSELNYYDELPYFYNACTINFNTTSLQMKGGVNQRVFDVPACGGFLITDYRDQIEQLFDIGKEVICYKHPNEIGDIIRYYLRNITLRDRICNRSYCRVMHEHTYTHRLTKMIKIMRQIYG